MASTLPDDLMLDITVRSDIVSIIRCNASCKSVRGRILEEVFCRQHRAGNNAGSLLLLGVSYIRCDRITY
uniref:F-box domain-containing protein n=1 Tax=Oryza punctata TaxID=4537 RepID=A0A0E0KJN0_ORYPU